MRRVFFDELDTTETPVLTSNVSGVHVASTRPAPYLEEADDEDRLLGSIPREELSAVFQPILDLRNGALLGYEVLPRCYCEGLTDPEELFARAIFEKTAGELGRTIRSLAIDHCAGAPLYISVHPAELKDRFLVRPDDPMCFHDAPVFLQFSQAALSTVAIQILRELSRRGEVGLVLDNLGAGPASLKQLIDLMPRTVKLDRELSAGLDKSRRKQIVVRGLVSMCGELGATVIAKGLDCESELHAAIDCGVTGGQGYLLGEPTAVPS